MAGKRLPAKLKGWQKLQVRTGAPPGTRTPNPRIKSPLLWYQISALNASLCRSVRTSSRIPAGQCRALTGGTGAAEQTTSNHGQRIIAACGGA